MNNDAPVVAGDGGGSIYKREHFVTLTLAGDAEIVRARLVSAVERLGYRTLSDEPLVVQRGLVNGSSLNFLDYGRTITFRLKPSGETATQVDFNYAVGYTMGSRGAQRVIEREAAAIAALASELHAATDCASCGATATGDSRFCRRCGAPMSETPAELEVLRLSAETYAGMQGVVIGTVGFALSVITFALLLAVKGAAGLVPAVVFAALWLVMTFPAMLFGIRRLRAAVNSAPNDPKALKTPLVAPTITVQAATTHSNLSGESVTESTTQLLNAALEEQSVTTGQRKNDAV